MSLKKIRITIMEHEELFKLHAEIILQQQTLKKQFSDAVKVLEQKKN